MPILNEWRLSVSYDKIDGTKAVSLSKFTSQFCIFIQIQFKSLCLQQLTCVFRRRLLRLANPAFRSSGRCLFSCPPPQNEATFSNAFIFPFYLILFYLLVYFDFTFLSSFSLSFVYSFLFLSSAFPLFSFLSFR